MIDRFGHDASPSFRYDAGMLEMPAEWRFGNPGELDPATVNDFYHLILKIAGQGETWGVLELFKSKFNGGSSTSSSESWAASDLHVAMHSAGNNGPAFIGAYWSAAQQVTVEYPGHAIPDVGIVNSILVERGELYEVRPPKLVRRGSVAPPQIEVPEQGLGERARALINTSLAQADRLLSEGRHRLAVQEILWLLETVSTAFEGREVEDGSVEGKYFSTIVRDLRRHHKGKALAEILGWIVKLHGFLSSPSGGGVRHGTRLAVGVEPTAHEAALYCNLTRSYLGYLLAEVAAAPVTG